MDKLYVLVGEDTNDVIKIIATWTKMPSQDNVNRLVSKLEDTYKSFALMEDILFLQGKAVAGGSDSSIYVGY